MPESSSLKAINLAKNLLQIAEIWNCSRGIVIYRHHIHTWHSTIVIICVVSQTTNNLYKALISIDIQ